MSKTFSSIDNLDFEGPNLFVQCVAMWIFKTFEHPTQAQKCALPCVNFSLRLGHFDILLCLFITEIDRNIQYTPNI